MKNPEPYLMKNGIWVLKGISSETGIKLFKIVGKTKPSISQSKFESFKNLFTSRQCECEKLLISFYSRHRLGFNLLN